MHLATAACNFSTSELQKVLRDRQFFTILTSKCASRYSGVQFLDIVTFKSGPKLTCFVHFYLKMCFSPQRRAIFEHLNFKKCSEPLSFLTFWLGNVILATAACAIFGHRNFQKWSEADVFCTFSLEYVLLATAACYFWFLLWPHDSAPAALTSLLYRLTRHTNHWKNTAFRDVPNIWRVGLFFLLTFALLHLLSSDSTSSSDFTFFWLYFIYLLFISFSTLHIVGSLLFKLPSMI